MATCISLFCLKIAFGTFGSGEVQYERRRSTNKSDEYQTEKDESHCEILAPIPTILPLSKQRCVSDTLLNWVGSVNDVSDSLDNITILSEPINTMRLLLFRQHF